MERTILRGWLWFFLFWSAFSVSASIFFFFILGATQEDPSRRLEGQINAATAWIATVLSIGFLACSAGPRSAPAEPAKPSRPKMGPYPDRPGSQSKPRRTWDEIDE
jgi:hypothetical protein